MDFAGGRFKEITVAMNNKLPKASLPPAWRYALIVWGISRAATCLWGVLLWTSHLVPLEPIQSYYYNILPILTGPAAALTGIWLRWDAVHYLNIAQNGYNSAFASGFFPLYPLLGRGLAFLFGGDTLASLMAVSNLALLVVMVQLYQITTEHFPEPVARRAVWALAVFPGSIFFYAAYPHSLTLALILGAYQAARRKRWLASFGLGLVSGLAHPTALPVFFLLGWMVVREWRADFHWKKLPLAALPASSVLGSVLFLAWRLGQGFPEYGQVSSQLWGVQVIPPYFFFSELNRLVHNMYFPIIGWVDLLVIALVVGILILTVRKFPLEFWFYQASMFVYYISYTTAVQPFIDFTRHTIMMFPLFIEIGALTQRKWIQITCICLMACIQMYLMYLFFAWIWIG
jgi:hypothetical protein